MKDKPDVRKGKGGKALYGWRMSESIRQPTRRITSSYDDFFLVSFCVCGLQSYVFFSFFRRAWLAFLDELIFSF
jgi:hypothetical protein